MSGDPNEEEGEEKDEAVDEGDDNDGGVAEFECILEDLSCACRV